MSDKEKNALVFSSFFRQIKNSEKKLVFMEKIQKKIVKLEFFG